MNKNSGKKGFTLVELLVVISIIAMLLAVLLPSLNKARNMAKAVLCGSNLKQWGVICQLYAEDNGGKFIGTRLGHTEHSWVWVLRKYYQNMPEIRFCPVATKTSTPANNPKNPFALNHLAAWGPYPDSTNTINEYGSYGLNGWTYNLPASEINAWYPAKDYWRTFTVTQANNIPVMLDCSIREGSPRDGSRAPEYHGDFRMGYEWELARFCLDRHDGRVNCVFLDGTVRKVGLKELWTLKWHRNFDTKAGPSRGWTPWMSKYR